MLKDFEVQGSKWGSSLLRLAQLITLVTILAVSSVTRQGLLWAPVGPSDVVWLFKLCLDQVQFVHGSLFLQVD